MGGDELEPGSPAGSAANVDAVVADKAAPESGAQSSGAPEGEKFDLQSVVRDAVQKARGDSASPAGQDEQKSGQPAEAASSEQKPEGAGADEFAGVPFNSHPRFRALVAERNEYKADATQFRQVTTFLDQQGITPDEAADFLILRGLLKNDPQAAWAQLRPIVQRLLVDAGEVLAPDLQQKVQQGQMTREAAVEFSRLRAQNQTVQRQATARAEMEQRDAQAREVQARVNAVADWERETRARDVDFDAKAEALQKEVLWLQRRDGQPKTPAEARKMIETAYATVTKELTARVQPKPQQNPIRGTGRAANGQFTPAAPKTTLEIIRNVRAAG